MPLLLFPRARMHYSFQPPWSHIGQQRDRLNEHQLFWLHTGRASGHAHSSSTLDNVMDASHNEFKTCEILCTHS